MSRVRFRFNRYNERTIRLRQLLADANSSEGCPTLRFWKGGTPCMTRGPERRCVAKRESKGRFPVLSAIFLEE
jgi:hypothetical protein